MRMRAEEGSRASIVTAALEAQQAALNAALERNSNGEAGRWASANGQAHGTITPLMTFVNGEGSFCREVEQEFTVDGHDRTIYGLGCRGRAGEWQVRRWRLRDRGVPPGPAP